LFQRYLLTEEAIIAVSAYLEMHLRLVKIHFVKCAISDISSNSASIYPDATHYLFPTSFWRMVSFSEDLMDAHCWTPFSLKI